MLTDDDTTFEDAAQIRRETAARTQRAWRGKPLLWTFSRELKYEALHEKAAPLSEAQRAALERRDACLEGSAEHEAASREALHLLGGRSTPRLRNSIIALWLMLHQSADWNAQADRASLLCAIDAWVDTHLADVTSAELVQIVQLVDQVIEDAESTRAIPRPSAPSAEGDTEAGNSPRP